MAKKTLIGTISSDKMINTVVVEVTRHIVHPLYKKKIKITKKYSADTNGMKLVIGDLVKMEEIPPMSKTKHFKVIEKLEDARMPQIKTEDSAAVEPARSASQRDAVGEAVATEIVEAVASVSDDGGQKSEERKQKTRKPRAVKGGKKE